MKLRPNSAAKPSGPLRYADTGPSSRGAGVVDYVRQAAGFCPDQLTQLAAPIEPANVKTRERGGKQLSYIEGWFAIAEANRVFGYDGWDRETVHCERVFARTLRDRTHCACMARVRVRVRARDLVIVREGSGFGEATAADPGEAHERALKSAETDATKRALATFGSRFGLSLYDKGQKREAPDSPAPPASKPMLPDAGTFQLRLPDGPVEVGLSPEGVCSALRQVIGLAGSVDELGLIVEKNADLLLKLRAIDRLRSAKGEHYADIIERLVAGRMAELRAAVPQTGDLAMAGSWESTTHRESIAEDNQSDAEASAGIASQVSRPLAVAQAIQVERPAPQSRISQLTGRPVIDKSVLSLSTERRIRSKAHLAAVAAEPCMICGQGPSHAHHIRFAQAKGLSQKVSDEFTVPLCAEHHNALHSSRTEAAWWREAGLDPLAEAYSLWIKSCTVVLETRRYGALYHPQ